MKKQTIKTSIYIDRELWNEVKILAIRQGVTATEVLERALESYIKAKGSKSS
jgi:Ribbon-helix-helix protein, copG family